MRPWAYGNAASAAWTGSGAHARTAQRAGGRAEAARHHRVPRPLGPAAREALHSLRQRGADTLADDFTADELKRAYRQLARRHHPDQHPGASATARAELAAAFRQIHEAYRLLAGASGELAR